MKAKFAIGWASETGAIQRLVNADDGEMRIEGRLNSNATFLVVTTHLEPLSSVVDQRVAATAVAISASASVKDHASARTEIDRASDAIWIPSTIAINGEPTQVNILQLLSGNWAGYLQYRSSDILLGFRGIDPRDVILATVDPSDLNGDSGQGPVTVT